MKDPLFYMGAPRNGYKPQYGIHWKPDLPPLQVHLACFREQMAGRIPWGHAGYTPRWFFKAIAKAVWPENPKEESDARFIWNPWADWMLDKACQGNYLAVAGCAGLGKSEFFAIWLIIQFLSDPENTLCMTTSMTLSASKMKMWSKVTQYWMPLENMGMPGKLIDSLGRIRYVTPDGKSPKGDLAGITLIPSDRKRERDALESIIGIHPKRAIFVADDLTGLSEAVTEACFSNLSMGCEYFQFVGLANPKSYFDSFGKFAKPKAGWESISVEDLEWETERGWCIHCDATKNPRITDGDERLTWMLSKDDIADRIQIDGAKSASYWRMVRGFWCPEGIAEYVYTETEIVANKGDIKAEWMDEEKVTVAFLDPAYVHGGDRCIMQFGTYGKNLRGDSTLEFNEHIEFHEDVTDKETERSVQLVAWMKEQCLQKGVIPRNCGLDETGAGKVLKDFVHLFWSKEVLGIDFGGAASERPVSVYDPTPGNQRYGNRVTEIWYSCKEALHTGQIKGIGPHLMEEMTMRKKDEEKNVYTKIFVQKKKDMKAECGFSPDIADSALGLSELCRMRFGFSSKKAAKEIHKQPVGKEIKTFKSILQSKFSAFRPKPEQNPWQRPTNV